MSTTTRIHDENSVPCKLTVDLIDDLLTAARTDLAIERRSDPRYAFFAPVSLEPDHEPGRRYSAFSREISLSGIGLIHNTELKPGELYCIIIQQKGVKLSQWAEVVWCRPVGEGWYTSGFRFVQRSTSPSDGSR